MNPFVYPKSKHVRSQKPRVFRRYQPYKKYLRKEFNGKCVYCCLPDRQKGYDNFGVDHYKPQNMFPELETEYSNLFYSCNSCNRHKGKFWPNLKQQKLGHFVPNPCDHQMYDHLRYKGGHIISHSVTGEFTIEWLDLNDEISIEYRHNVLGLINLVEEVQRSVSNTIRDLIKVRISETDFTKRKKQGLQIKENIKTYRELEGKLKFLTGD